MKSIKERKLKGLWVAGTVVVSFTVFVVLGIMLGGSLHGWGIQVISASAIFAVILANPDSDGACCTEGKAGRRVLQ